MAKRAPGFKRSRRSVAAAPVGPHSHPTGATIRGLRNAGDRRPRSA